MDYIASGTQCQGKREFAQVLRDWLDSDRETVIGEPGSFGGKPLIRITVDGHKFHLNGDSRDEGVHAYLRRVDEHGSDDLPWQVIANQKGKVNAVAFGQPPEKIPYFYLYADDEASSPYTV